MPAAGAEPVLAAAGIAVAAGRHGHLIRLAGLAILVLAVLAVAGFAAAAVIRRRRRGPRTRQPASPLRAAPPPGSSAAVAAVQLTKIYQLGNVEVRALDGVSLEIPAGAMVCIMGKSGSGKSTLLRQLGLIDLPTSGSIWLRGQEVTRLPERRRGELRLRTLGYVFQEYALLPELTALENVCLPAMMAGQSARHCRRRALDTLDLVALGHRARHRPRELSGGEQQRVAIARALVNEPRIIYADEPTANLDSISARTVMQTLRTLNETLGVTVVFVSHDPDDAQYATRLIHLSDGKLAGALQPAHEISGDTR
ncbi:MAG: ABC transporter ATP-binding protein [Gemmatimonadota bacterium]